MSSVVPPGNCPTHGYHGRSQCPNCSTSALPFPLIVPVSAAVSPARPGDLVIFGVEDPGHPHGAAVSPAEPPEGNRVTDPLGDAITVLSNVKIEDPSARIDTEDAEMRVQLALSYLEMIGSHRALALVEYARQRSTRDDVVEALDELEGLVKPRGR